MEQAPTEIIEKIAGHCDEPTLNSLIRTNSTTNEKVNAYPGQVYEYIKRNQPEKLAQELLAMIDPASLITYQLDYGINDLEKFTGDIVDISDYPLILKFKLGTLEIARISLQIDDVYKAFYELEVEAGHPMDRHGVITGFQLKDITAFKFDYCPDVYILVRNIADYMGYKIKTNYAGIRAELSTEGLDRHIVIQFQPDIYDAILRDLFKIRVQYGKFLAKQ